MFAFGLFHGAVPSSGQDCAVPNGGMFANDELVIVHKEETGVLTRYRSVSLGFRKIAGNTEAVVCIR